jgi:hypothetical protein
LKRHGSRAAGPTGSRWFLPHWATPSRRSWRDLLPGEVTTVNRRAEPRGDFTSGRDGRR